MNSVHIITTSILLKNWGARFISYYVTTPIFYVNASPHIGHVHTFLVADALNRYNRLQLGKDDTIFSTGTDEHGVKIQNAAEHANMSCEQFCDMNAKEFKNLFNNQRTTVTDFLRTSEGRHRIAVQSVWKELERRGYIYKADYSGWYCETDEVFIPDSQIIREEIEGETHHLDSNRNRLRWTSEKNYLFKVDGVKDNVLRWLKDKKPVLPESFNQQAMELVSDINDISISRPRNRLQWGIQVPNDPSQTVYVWLDALTNYLTVIGYPETLHRWPIDCQVFGKDILKFHAIYWPMFLSALSLDLPKKLICHSHWLRDSIKMSKSKGNVVDPWSESRSLSNEGLRYFLLRAATPHSDNDFDHVQALRRINAELADTYGNLMSRCCAPAINPRQVISRTLLASSSDAEFKGMLNDLKNLSDVCAEHYEQANFYRGVDEIMRVLRSNNILYERHAPWKLVKIMKDNDDSYRIYQSLQTLTFETIRICSILLSPIVPEIAGRALTWLGEERVKWSDARLSACVEQFKESDMVAEKRLHCEPKSILFARIKDTH